MSICKMKVCISNLQVEVDKQDHKCDHVESLKFQTAQRETTRNNPCAQCVGYSQHKLNLCDRTRTKRY